MRLSWYNLVIMYVFNSEKPISWSSNFTDKLLHPIVLKNTGVKVVQVLVLLYCNEKFKLPLTLATYAATLFINKEFLIFQFHRAALPVMLLAEMKQMNGGSSPLEIWDQMFNSISPHNI